MKHLTKATSTLAVILFTFPTLAEQVISYPNALPVHHPHEQFAYQQVTSIPRDSTPFEVSDTIPEQCRSPHAEQYIRKLQSGDIKPAELQADASVPKELTGCLMFNDKGQMVKNPSCDIKDTYDGLTWKNISEYPEVIGYSLIGKGEWQPHFHDQPECYYIPEGEALVLANGKYTPIKAGQYIYFPGTTIHGYFVEKNPPFGVFYWMPKNANLAGFKYYWRHSVKNLKVAEDAFIRVDEIRKRDLGLPPIPEKAPIN